MHSALPACPQPLLVRSLQLVEVRPYAEEEEANFMLTFCTFANRLTRSGTVRDRVSNKIKNRVRVGSGLMFRDSGSV